MLGDCAIEGCRQMATHEVRTAWFEMRWLPICENHAAVYGNEGLRVRLAGACSEEQAPGKAV